MNKNAPFIESLLARADATPGRSVHETAPSGQRVHVRAYRDGTVSVGVEFQIISDSLPRVHAVRRLSAALTKA